MNKAHEDHSSSDRVVSVSPEFRRRGWVDAFRSLLTLVERAMSSDAKTRRLLLIVGAFALCICGPPALIVGLLIVDGRIPQIVPHSLIGVGTLTAVYRAWLAWKRRRSAKRGRSR